MAQHERMGRPVTRIDRPVAPSPITIESMAQFYGVDSQLLHQTAWIMPRVNHLRQVTRPTPIRMIFPDFRILKTHEKALQNFTVAMPRTPDVNQAFGKFMRMLAQKGITPEAYVMRNFLTYIGESRKRYTLPFAVVRDRFPRQVPNVNHYTAWFSDPDTSFVNSTKAIASFLKARNLSPVDVVLIEKPWEPDRPQYGSPGFIAESTPSVGLKHIHIFAHEPRT